MLTEQLKGDIQGAYSRLLEAQGFKARSCQKQMIAEIARTLGNIEVNADGERIPGPNTCVVEAGTGTGKTIAYTMAALPIAKALGKKLVISTATVALQEQISYQDLPDIRKHANLDVTFALAKGRRRYLCLARFDMALQASGEQSLQLFDDDVPGEVDRQLYQEMLDKLGEGKWNGDRDDWTDEIPHQSWSPISTDHTRCTGRQCSHFENCIFYRARENIHRVDCIVTNHDLVLADLMMGGGTVLPAPEDTIYVFDEGHHLPDKASNHFSSFLQLNSTTEWLIQLPQSVQQCSIDMPDLVTQSSQSVVEQQATVLIDRLQEMSDLVLPFADQASGGGDRRHFRFPMGVVPKELQQQAGELMRQFASLHRIFAALNDNLQDALDESSNETDEYWLATLAGITVRLDAAVRLWMLFNQSDPAGKAPYARWLVFEEEGELQLHASPISVSGALQDLLWQRSFGVVVTSATLSMAGDFSRFKDRSGILPDNQYLTLPSPFNFLEQGVLRVPAMTVDPSDPDAHTLQIAEMIPRLVLQEKSSLVLFTSWRQLLGAMRVLDSEFAERVLRQGDLTRSEIVRTHKANIDAGEPSCIFGLASFAEGIDLPGEYCDHVVICKIPFAVPDDPVGATLAEWIENRGGNAFEEVMLPDAALRMVQACGRLLRTETDRGTITILDRRLVTKGYGSRLQRALPPFRRVIENQ
ncbi:MAG: ATP-dependent DNA helicase DinG [Pseudomonadales bacterium]|nr:ATP-dependent DNA helicase DinG [Pseudomonadales bacterium]